MNSQLGAPPLKLSSSGHFGNIPVCPVMSWPARTTLSGESRDVSSPSKRLQQLQTDAGFSLEKVSGPINYLERFYITVGSVHKNRYLTLQKLNPEARFTVWKK